MPRLRPSTEAWNPQVSFCDNRNWFASVCIKHGVFQLRRLKRVTRCPTQAFNFNKKRLFFHRSSVSRANSSGHVYLTPTHDTACSFVSSGALCTVSGMYLVGWDVHIQTTNAPGRRPRPYSTYSQLFRPGRDIEASVWAGMHDLQESALTTWALSSGEREPQAQCLPRCLPLCSGPQTIGRFGANTSGDDCTPHRAGKYTKSSGSPGLPTANTFIPCGLAISSYGPTSISAIAPTAFDESCKWPKQRHFIEADIQPHFCNREYFGVQKAKNGDRGTIVYSAALN